MPDYLVHGMLFIVANIGQRQAICACKIDSHPFDIAQLL